VVLAGLKAVSETMTLDDVELPPVTVKLVLLVLAPAGVVTRIGPEEAACGTTALILESERTV
jgi:hypothetical protein